MALGTRAKILLVDDDVDFVQMNKAVLEFYDYVVVTAFDGEGALRVAREERPDLILLDVMMNRMDEGFLVSSRLKEDPDLKHVPIVFLTAINRLLRPLHLSADDEWIGAESLLEKPIKPEDLLAEVKRVLAAARGGA